MGFFKITMIDLLNQDFLLEKNQKYFCVTLYGNNLTFRRMKYNYYHVGVFLLSLDIPSYYFFMEENVLVEPFTPVLN